MPTNSQNIHKLQKAINIKGGRILYTTNQFYSKEQDRPITIYVIKKSIYNEDKGRMENKEIFSATSQIQIVLFLRDYYFQMIGKEVPHDNAMWEECKRRYFLRKGVLDVPFVERESDKRQEDNKE